MVRPGAADSGITSRPGLRVVSAESAICALNEAMIRASTDQVPLLALKGPVEATDEALYSAGQPERRSLVRLGGAANPVPSRLLFAFAERCGRRPWVPCRTLAETHETDVAPELFNPVLLIAPEVVGEFGPLDDRFSSAAGALLLPLQSQTMRVPDCRRQPCGGGARRAGMR